MVPKDFLKHASGKVLSPVSVCECSGCDIVLLVVRWYWVKGTQGLCVYYFLCRHHNWPQYKRLFKIFFKKGASHGPASLEWGRCGM